MLFSTFFLSLRVFILKLDFLILTNFDYSFEFSFNFFYFAAIFFSISCFASQVARSSASPLCNKLSLNLPSRTFSAEITQTFSLTYIPCHEISLSRFMSLMTTISGST